MNIAVHLFVSSRGDLLPRWQEAFPAALGFSPGQAAGVEASHVWLRLNNDEPVETQLSAAVSLAPDAAVLVLSDIPNDEEGLEAFTSGARAYANTHSSSEILRQIADVVSQGGLWIGPSLMQ